MQLSKQLLFNEHVSPYVSKLDGTGVKGSYSTIQFMVRLQDDIRRAANANENTPEKVQATSTILHENIHWWQHMGSNFGLLFSLVHPTLAHLSNKNLLSLVSNRFTYKSLKAFDEQYFRKNGKADILDLNEVMNNFHDLQYARLFALNNRNISNIQKDRRFFLNIGHCYSIMWASTIETLAVTIDRNFAFLPNIELWATKFQKLRDARVPGFYVDSPVHISPIGIKAIYEGQASFNQMQFLASALNMKLTLSDFANIGMYHGIYREAFDLFLGITKIDEPTNLLGPEIGLFLITCDLAINPTNGFPLEIYDFENFIIKNDPGIRFILFCRKVAEQPSYYFNKITAYSKSEYVTLSKELCEAIGCKCSYESIKNVLAWSSDDLQQVLEEEKSFKFTPMNHAIRVLLSKYYRFQEDKFEHPNIICWFGYHSSSIGGSNDRFTIADNLYQKHHALFIDDYDGEIKPVIFKGRELKDIKESFDRFYQTNIFYDLVIQWIGEEGPFKLNYDWLVNTRASKFTTMAKELFRKHFGISTDDLTVL